MSKKERSKIRPVVEGVFAQIEGLTQVDPAALEEFQRVMTEEVIPDIVQTIEERQMLAAESQHWQLKQEFHFEDD